MPAPRLVSIQVAAPRRIEPAEAPNPAGEAWTTGFFKQPVSGAVWLGQTNVAGDGQGDRKNHGGPDKAVLAYAAAHYPHWRGELALPDLPYGAFAENFTVDGLDEGTVCIGDRFAIGGALLQVSQPRQPCWKIAARWQLPDLTARVEASGRTGWYLRVLCEGSVAAGADVLLLERPNPAWTIVRATSVMRRRGHADTAELAACPGLSDAWQTGLSARVRMGVA
ncbi:MAG: MOSC domain-containing protein [Dehalococcoidia bacterium]